MKRTVIAILIAVLVVAIGAGLCFAGLSAVNFKVRDLGTARYVTNTHELGESFTRVEMDMDTADVDVLPAEDGKCRVICVEREKYPHTVKVENDTLILRSAKDQKWNFDIGFLVKSPSVTVYLPAADYESLKVAADTGAVKLVAGVSFKAVDMDADTGTVTVDGADVKKLKISADTGRIAIANMTPETVELDADTGSVRVTDVVCSGNMRIETDTGSIRLEDADAANLYLKADTGSITGTIRTPKTFVTKASTGSVKVPDTTGDGRCEAYADTGSIKLSISGE